MLYCMAVFDTQRNADFVYLQGVIKFSAPTTVKRTIIGSVHLSGLFVMGTTLPAVFPPPRLAVLVNDVIKLSHPTSVVILPTNPCLLGLIIAFISRWSLPNYISTLTNT